jgi:hypothetical protein
MNAAVFQTSKGEMSGTVVKENVKTVWISTVFFKEVKDGDKVKEVPYSKTIKRHKTKHDVRFFPEVETISE